MTAGKTIALTIQTFVDRVTSLLFNTLSRFVIMNFIVIYVYIDIDIDIYIYLYI